MIIIIFKADIEIRKKLFPLFESINETMILSCLQGHMGHAWVDDPINPTAAQIIVGDFAFFGGNPNSEAAEELLKNLPERILVIVNDDEWEKAIENVHNNHFEKFHRYGFKKNPEHLNRNHIKSFLSKIPEGYELKKIDADIVKKPSLHRISPDFTSQFDSMEDYLRRGIGYCILHEDEVVCGASSYSIYDEGIEIEIGTHRDHRKKGLATITGAAVILDCLDRGLYPSWDAANPSSKALAEKLGYEFEGPYDTYFIDYYSK